MEGDLGGLYRGVAGERLDGTDICAALEEVDSERVYQDMAGDAFGNVGSSDGGGEVPLERVLMEVVAGVFSGARVWAEFVGREDELPGPFARGIGVFAGEGSGLWASPAE